MLVLIHKECGGPALNESPVGEVCAIPVDRFLFSCFTCPGDQSYSPELSRKPISLLPVQQPTHS